MNVAGVLFEASAGGRLVMRGNDRRKFLHNFCTNEIQGLADGDTREAFVPDRSGHVLAHVWVIAQPGELWLHSLASPVDALKQHLEKYVITEDVTIEDATSTTSRVVVCGADAEAAATAIVNLIEPVVSRGRVKWLDAEDVLLWTDSTVASEFSLAAVAAGLTLGSPDEWETRRIAALLPIHGRDVSVEHFAQEVDRTRQAISFSKGCYLGQETIARIDSRGHVNRLLRGLVFDGDLRPVTGAGVRARDESAPTGQEVGQVSSVAPRVGTTGMAAAMAMVRREVAREGTEVSVETSDGPVAARIVEPR